MMIVYWPIFGNWFTEVHSSCKTFPRAVDLAPTVVVGNDEPGLCLWFVPGTIQQED